MIPGPSEMARDESSKKEHHLAAFLSIDIQVFLSIDILVLRSANKSLSHVMFTSSSSSFSPTDTRHFIPYPTVSTTPLSGDTASGRSGTSIWRRVLYPHSPFGLVARLSATHKRAQTVSGPPQSPPRSLEVSGENYRRLSFAYSDLSVELIFVVLTNPQPSIDGQ